MQQEDIIENTLEEPVLAYRNNQKDNDPYFFDPLDDVGFKRLFASQQNADLIVSFINHILMGKRQVVSLEVIKNEYPGETHEEGGATIDMVCKDHNGNFFLVEMQRQYHKNFRERSLFYASRLITEQAPRGNRRAWAYALTDVYVISLLEKFTVSEEKNDLWQHHISLINMSTGKVFSNRLAFTYIELSNFNKPENELENILEQWIYALKNLNHLKQTPATFNDSKLMEFCDAARYMNLTKTEKNMISAKTKQRWDYYSVMETAKEMGEEKGRAIGEELGKELGKEIGKELGKAQGAHEKAITVAMKLKAEGFNPEKIAELTELDVTEIENL
jgi:predicted transposase/invertase (TIGR01784 family)